MNETNTHNAETIQFSGEELSELKRLGRDILDEEYRCESDAAEIEFLGQHRRKKMQREARDRRLGHRGLLSRLR